MNKYTVPATMSSISTLKDKTLKVTFHCQEMPADAAAECIRLNQTFGWLIFASEEATETFVPDAPPPEFKQSKTPAQRLRAVLFVWWQQLGAEGDFEFYYREKMEMMINLVKGKLDQ